MSEPLRYPIRTVARMTGLGVDTLRAWERRHEAVAPSRDQRGRMYSDGDVRRLVLLRDAVANGHSIGRIAHLPDEQLRDAAAVRRPMAQTPSVSAGTPRSWDPDAIVAALERYDGASVDAALGLAANLLGPPAFLQDVLLPLLNDIGTRWSDGRSTVAHEHLLSSVARNILGTLIRTHTRADTPSLAVFATPSGEHHELGTLGAATLAASGGLGVLYLGPNLPSADIVQMTRDVNADAVVLGVTGAGDALETIRPAVEVVAAQLPRDVELWLGGPAAATIAESVRPRAVALDSYRELGYHLERLGARF